ncbi:LysR family transcriptional regulator [Pseudomonas sp. NFX15]|uniref:LysR family transcriptional regulator n=1 Tax=Pseudomonas sp. NFX15 TaxID=2816958 RepID=UPI003B8E39DF
MIKDARLLVEFAAVAEAGSFTLAARELGVAQPWLSAQVRKLEDQLGVRLFDRTSRQLKLTSWGEELLQAAAPLRRQTDITLAQVTALCNRARDSLYVGLPPSGVDEVILAILQSARLGDRYDVSVEHGVSESLISRLQQGVLDLIFFIGSFDLDETIIEKLPICQVYVHLILDQRDPLAAAPHVRIAQLRGRTLSVFPRRLNPELYDDIANQTSAANVVIGQFPEVDLQEPASSPASNSPIRIALATVLGGSSVPPGYKSVRVIDIDDCWLQVARMKSNSSGPVRRTFWQAAQALVQRLDDER